MEGSAFRPSSRSTGPWSSRPCSTPAKRGLFTAGTQSKQRNAFHMRCLRRLLNIRWQDKIPDTEVLHTAETESIYAVLKRSQLRWAGHVCRTTDKRLLYGELQHGKRSRGGQRKRYKDTLKARLKGCGLDPETWEADAQCRTSWRSAVRHGVADFERRRIREAERKRQLRNTKDSSCLPPTQPALNPNVPSLLPNIPCKDWPHQLAISAPTNHCEVK